jgi:hypothetical protein
VPSQAIDGLPARRDPLVDDPVRAGDRGGHFAAPRERATTNARRAVVAR